MNKAMPSEGLSDGILRYFVKVGMTVRDLCKIPQNPLNSHQDI
ncbi:hypothetical protein NMBM01240355_0979 [Neisseria meningitidis M01-240355]|nr:hypothetical protein NMBM01240355_0979 [Neisseria meningitidis M01-240355]